MQTRNFVFAGAALLAIGLFTPIVSMPLVGTINLFGNGSNLVALAILVLAALSVGLGAKGRLDNVTWPAAAATGLVLYSFGRLQFGLAEMRASLRELEDNPLAGFAQGAMSTVQIQWGWLILFAGAGLLVYAAFSTWAAGGRGRLTLGDKVGKAVAVASALALIIPVAADVFEKSAQQPSQGDSSESMAAATTASGENAVASTAEEAAYIRQNLELYDLSARYYDSILDGRVPGVDFKIQNNGDRTLDRIEVTVVFLDESGRPIAEEVFNPVLVSEYNFGGDNGPLRPNYIWQQERGQFYSATSVPTEWSTGRVQATITAIEFGANE